MKILITTIITAKLGDLETARFERCRSVLAMQNTQLQGGRTVDHQNNKEQETDMHVYSMGVTLCDFSLVSISLS